WRGTLMGVALAIDTRNDLQNVNYESLALTQKDKDDHITQLDVLTAYFYLRGLDFFGGMPIFTSNEGENVPRATSKEVFDHVEKIIKTALPKLAKRPLGFSNDGAITQGSAAAMLAQLYFNAKSYIGESRDAECDAICKDIISGVYGNYALATNWQQPFNFDNAKSDEMLWGIPSAFKMLEYNWFFNVFYHYSAPEFFDMDIGGPWNGSHFQPSLTPGGTEYTFNIGKPFARFNKEDLRKRQYKYKGGKNYEGMMLFGPQLKPNGEPCLGTQEYSGEPLVLVDQVARFSELKDKNSPNFGKDPKDLESKVQTGEENSGVRLMKIPIPNKANNSLRWASHHQVIRLTEIYYMRAEIMFNKGDLAGAAAIFNQIRARNFENGADPDPVTTANLNKYRLASEWGIEFLGEGRRRTDLIRWGMFHTEDWWGHKAHNDKNKCVFPVPENAISGNNALVQNPGY
ncbi:MAG: RagB/SusD family nutrient uptake outer membrane protein, partial [Rikenellaceae bacterium]